VLLAVVGPVVAGPTTANSTVGNRKPDSCIFIHIKFGISYAVSCLLCVTVSYCSSAWEQHHVPCSLNSCVMCIGGIWIESVYTES